MADLTPLQQLVDRARLASERMSSKNPNRALLREMAIGLVALATKVAELESEKAEKPRIIIPR